MSLKIKLKLSAHAQIGSTGRSAATAKELVLTVDGEGEHLTLLVGVAEASYALSTLQQAHTKLLEKGKMTLAFAGRGGGKAPPHNVFLAAEPAVFACCTVVSRWAAERCSPRSISTVPSRLRTAVAVGRSASFRLASSARKLIFFGHLRRNLEG